MKRVFLMFKFFMVLVYIALGVMILFFDVLPVSFGKAAKTFFGIVFMLYALFRIYTLYKSFVSETDDE